MTVPNLCTHLSKTSLTPCSLAPMYLLSNSGPLIEINLKPHCFAAAPAIKVFPVPGGP